MSRIVAGLQADYPQDNQNRTLSELVLDILEYAGGLDDVDEKAKAKRALESAVRQFNHISWSFNRSFKDVTFLADTSEYIMLADFYTPWRAMIIDDNDKNVKRLQWVPYDEWLITRPNQRTGTSLPLGYTIRNIHEDGLVTFFPPLGPGPFTYPKARIHYHRRIIVPIGSGVMNIPSEVEEAIVQEAVAIMISKVRNFAEARDQRLLSRDAKQVCELRWRSWEDY